MFKRLDSADRQLRDAPVRIRFNGAELACRAGDSVAAALFAHGVDACRDTVVNEVPRGPFCMMGICYDCLVTIDGQPNRQACMTQVREGMAVERQAGARKVQA
ncbi:MULTISPECIES: (2Fe-2S)-binding protein [Bordetella]|uniref:(2Fe-2S)-binding protein n=2 Tax=Bordetella TaxID=517 RepID=A0A261W8N0_9BORD|nr:MULTISPECIES: (2Fe-2S)-binding protein [Bordetella]MDM9560786.1 (2Fe-2S)-binding protein [Bordetella petrii]OZI82725.1 (2Fe-2S)-binding protein [Bordetella genomosp. 2]